MTQLGNEAEKKTLKAQRRDHAIDCVKGSVPVSVFSLLSGNGSFLFQPETSLNR